MKTPSLTNLAFAVKGSVLGTEALAVGLILRGVNMTGAPTSLGRPNTQQLKMQSSDTSLQPEDPCKCAANTSTEWTVHFVFLCEAKARSDTYMAHFQELQLLQSPQLSQLQLPANLANFTLHRSDLSDPKQ